MGTASWTDKALIESGWYPDSAHTAEQRLAYYARRFDLVEVDATYYHPPSEQTARLWVQRTPADFRFNIKAFSLLTGHPTRPAALYADLRPRTDPPSIYPTDLPAATYEQVWDRFLSALSPLHEAGKLGALLFQFPPWFTISRSRKEQLVEVAERCRPLPVAIELRHSSWFAGDNAEETLSFLRKHELPLVCVDMPQGHRSSVPPVVTATADLAMVRIHCRIERWTSKDIQEKYGYLYTERELAQWVPGLLDLAGQARETHVLMNNCRGDNPQRNAAQLLDLLADAERSAA